jgi:hypothetical protein
VSSAWGNAWGDTWGNAWGSVAVVVTVDTGITYKFSMGQLPGFAVNPLPLFWVDARQETRI